MVAAADRYAANATDGIPETGGPPATVPPLRPFCPDAKASGGPAAGCGTTAGDPDCPGTKASTGGACASEASDEPSADPMPGGMPAVSCAAVTTVTRAATRPEPSRVAAARAHQ
jgi:hypothetical protein